MLNKCFATVWCRPWDSRTAPHGDPVFTKHRRTRVPSCGHRAGVRACSPRRATTRPSSGGRRTSAVRSCVSARTDAVPAGEKGTFNMEKCRSSWDVGEINIEHMYCNGDRHRPHPRTIIPHDCRCSFRDDLYSYTCRFISLPTDQD